MQPFVRRLMLVLLASLALQCGSGARSAAANCILDRLCVAGPAATVLRCGRIVFVKTTWALVRVLKHEFLARRGTAGER